MRSRAGQFGSSAARLTGQRQLSRPRFVRGFVLCACLLLAACSRSPPDIIWLEQSRCDGAIAETALPAVFAFIQGTLGGDEAGDAADDDAAWNQPGPCLVFLSAGSGFAPALTTIGRGSDLVAALAQATQILKLLGENTGWVWFKLDLVQQVHRVNDPDSLTELPRSLFGLAAGENSGLAVLPEELVAYRLIDSDLRLRPERVAAFLNRFPHRSAVTGPGAESDWGFRFSTAGYFLADDAGYALYRGNRWQTPLEPEVILDSAVAGGRYLSSAVRPDGRFVYSYLPKTDREKNDYNILRHGGSVFSLLELYRVQPDPELLAAAERGLAYLQSYMQPCPDPETALCVVENGHIKLGGNALAIIAIVEHVAATGKREHLDTARRLAEWIVSIQDESGRFVPHKISWPEGAPNPFVSGYYPGEAVLALVRLYNQDADARWLAAARRAALWLITVRDGDTPTEQLAHDHWLSYGLSELYRLDPDPRFAEHTFKITQAIIQAQNTRPEGHNRDWLGSFYKPPRSTPAATRTEALRASFELAVYMRDFATAREITRAYCLGVSFQLRMQFGPESAMYLVDPQRVLGGFRRSLTNYELRNDYTQHNISSLLGLHAVLQQAPFEC